MNAFRRRLLAAGDITAAVHRVPGLEITADWDEGEILTLVSFQLSNLDPANPGFLAAFLMLDNYYMGQQVNSDFLDIIGTPCHKLTAQWLYHAVPGRHTLYVDMWLQGATTGIRVLNAVSTITAIQLGPYTTLPLDL